MGGAPSKTRKMTLENSNDPTSLIKVSEEVVERMKNKQNQPAMTQNVPQWPISAPPAAATTTIHLYEPSLSTIQLRQDHQEKLKENDMYWEKRIKNIDDKYKKMNQIFEEEYNNAKHELETNKIIRPKITTMPCLEAKEAVLKCYKDNSGKPMICADLVQKFQQCVDRKRIQMVSKGV